jgi:Caspase domain/Bacterial Ig domain/WD domain, G-beta repeat
VGDDGSLRLWDWKAGKETKATKSRPGTLYSVVFSPDGTALATGGSEALVYVWDVATLGRRSVSTGHAGAVQAVAFAPDGALVATGGADGGVRLSDVATGHERRVLSGQAGSVYAVAFAPDGALVATGGADGGVRLSDVATGHERRVLSGQAGSVYAVAFTPDGRLVAAASANGAIQLWDVGTGKADAVLAGHTGPALTLAFSPDGSLLASGGQDRSIRLTARQEVPVATVHPPAPPPVVASTPPSAVSPAPSDAVPHRPPPVVASTPPSAGQPPATDRPSPPSPSTSAASSSAGQQPPATDRPSPPGPSTSAASSVVKRPPPVIAIASPAETQQVTTEQVQLLGATASDSGVARIEFRVNGQLVRQQDKRGATRVSNTDFAESLVLRAGKNEIAVTVIDMDNQATTRALTVMRMQDPRLLDPGKIWAAVIGISQYKTVSSLQYADQDALSFYDYLLNQIGVPKDNLFLLTNQQATLMNVRRTLGTELKRKASPRDTVLIYFAGHGAPETDATSPDNDGLEKYLVVYDSDPDDLYTTGLPMREVEIIFERLAAERVVFIADTCFSGATTGRTFNTGGRRAVVSEAFLTRLSHVKGRVVLAASRASEVSAERPDMQHGVFTYYLLEGLRGKADLDGDNMITIDEIYNYVSQKVPAATAQNQHPVKKGEVDGQLVVGQVR